MSAPGARMAVEVWILVGAIAVAFALASEDETAVEVRPDSNFEKAEEHERRKPAVRDPVTLVFPGSSGVNSNSATQDVANDASGTQAETPGTRWAIGSENADDVDFDANADGKPDPKRREDDKKGAQPGASRRP